MENLNYDLIKESSKIYRENDNNNCMYYNMYCDSDNILRQFFGYKIVFERDFSTIYKQLSDRDDQFLYLATQEKFIILNAFFEVTYEYTWHNPTKYFDPACVSLIEDLFGNVIATNGQFGLLYLFKINRNNTSDATIDSVEQSLVDVSEKITSPASLEYIDGKTFCIDKISGKFFRIKGLFTDEISILDFSIQSIPCACVAIVRIKRTLCVIGVKCIELWYSDDSTEGISRYNNQLIECGTIFPNSVITINGKLLLLGSNSNSSPSILLLDLEKRQEEYIENNNLSYFFENISATSTVSGWSFSPCDLDFYILNINNKTCLLDINTKKFFFLTGDKTINSRFFAEDIFRFKNKWYFLGNSKNTVICELSSDITTYNGKQIPLVIKTNIMRLTSKQENFAIESIDVGIRPVKKYNEDYSNDENYIKIFCSWSEDASNTENFSEEKNVFSLPKNNFSTSIRRADFPRGRKILQIKIRFESPENISLNFDVLTINLS